MKKTISLVLTASVLLSSAQYVCAKNAYSTNRLSGEDRYKTSVNIAENFSKDKIQNVIIANGNDFADGLSGSILSKKINAPIILVDRNFNIGKESLDYLKNHLSSSGTVYILGGPASVGTEYESYIKSLGFANIKRLGGIDRFDTNNIIVNSLNIEKGTPIVITNGYGFADELSVSSIAAANGYPIFITDVNTLPNSVKSQILNIQPSKIYIIGGQGAVSDNIKTQIKSAVPSMDSNNIIRIGGQDRYETSLNICKYFKPNSDTVILASGENFPDALSGTALAGKYNAPIILTNGEDISKQKDYLDSNNYKNIILLGGNGVISTDIEDILNNKAITPYVDIGLLPNPTPDQVLSFVKKYSPESYYILNEEIKASGNKDVFKQYIEKDSIGFAEEINVIVHETTHKYTSDKNNGKGLTFYNGANDVLVNGNNVFMTKEIASTIPDNFRTYRFNDYINPTDTNIGAQVNGVYGLLNEFNAYYWGTKASYDLFNYYTQKNTNKDWIEYINGNGDYLAYAEFKFYILKYLLYAKQNHPDIYQSIINNTNFKTAFNSLDNNFYNLSQNCIERDKDIIKSKNFNSVYLDFYKHDYDLLMNEMNKNEYQQMLSILKN